MEVWIEIRKALLHQFPNFVPPILISFINFIEELLKEPSDIYDNACLTNAGEREDAARLDELRRTFKPLISNGELSKMNHHTDLRHRKDNDVKAKWNA